MPETKEESKDTEHSEHSEHTEHTERTDGIYSKMEWLSREFVGMASKATFAMASFLQGGLVLLQNYEVKDFLVERDVTGQKMKAGRDPVIDGLVVGNWMEEAVLVFVGASFSLSTAEECQSAIFDVTCCLCKLLETSRGDGRRTYGQS